ncbi:MAG TPA: FMN-binding negative transcriptional regulator [Armatimonadota bacterium]|nr:FMN-binding negative transcriptional regulator [Armatimonadota bacterium]
MYTPPAFEESRPEVLHDLMRRFSFAVLVTHHEAELTASHVPVLSDLSEGDHGVLLGHLARANEQSLHLQAGTEALAIFQGPHAYVSPSWYEAELAVPTWNYVAIHAYGTPVIVEDPSVVRAYLESLVNTYERAFERPWELQAISDEFIRNLIRGIVFFRMPICRLQGKLKLSQNRSEGDRVGVVRALEQSADGMGQQLAELMREMGLAREGQRDQPGGPVRSASAG